MATRTRLVRRAPLATRIKAYLNPFDFFLWLSEELNSNELEDTLKQWAVPIAVVLNVAFMVAKANSTYGGRTASADVFADSYAKTGGGWIAWLASFIAYLLMLASFANAIYTFTRKRRYRLFESSIDNVPNTPSAHRVRVDSSPVSSSPLKYLSNLIAATSAESRAHPDPSKDVWELAVWDPTPICLRLLCLFSPGHVLIYSMFLPLAPLDPRPSVTVVTTIALNLLLSAQMTLLQSCFSQQSKDASLINKEVFHEYDTKFVHPSLNKPVRDISTQTPSKSTPNLKSAQEVQTYTPTTFVNRGFHINPNPNYAAQFDPDGSLLGSSSLQVPTDRLAGQRSVTTPVDLRSPSVNSVATGSDDPPSSPLRPKTIFAPPTPAAYQQPMQSHSSSHERDGGSFGVYTHAYSPLKRSSFGFNPNADGRPRSPTKKARESSPVKMSGGVSAPNLLGQGSGAAALNHQYSQLRRGEEARGGAHRRQTSGVTQHQPQNRNAYQHNR